MINLPYSSYQSQQAQANQSVNIVSIKLRAQTFKVLVSIDSCHRNIEHSINNRKNIDECVSVLLRPKQLQLELLDQISLGGFELCSRTPEIDGRLGYCN